MKKVAKSIRTEARKLTHGQRGLKFYEASKKGLPAVKELLATGFEPTSGALAQSAAGAKLDIALCLLSQRRLVFDEGQLHFALNAAIEAGDRELTQAVLQRGADPNARIDIWQAATPLALTARTGQAHLIDILLEAGAKLNEQSLGKTALMWAAWLGHQEVVEKLLERGAAVNEQGERGLTALDFASRKKAHKAICVLLRKAGGLSKKELPKQTKTQPTRLLSLFPSLAREGSDRGLSEVRKAKTANPNWGVSHRALLGFLTDLHGRHPLVIEDCGSDFVKARFVTKPKTVNSVAREIYKFCPFVAAGHGDNLSGFTKHLAKTSTFHIWWD